MTEETQFQDLLDRHGSALTSWPERERAWAQHLLTRSGSARDILAQAETFDRDLLDAAPQQRPGAIREAVLAALPAHQLADNTNGWLRTLWWRWAAGASAAAASLVVSFYIGTTSGDIWPSSSGPDDNGAYVEFDSMLFGIGFDGGLT